MNNDDLNVLLKYKKYLKHEFLREEEFSLVQKIKLSEHFFFLFERTPTTVLPSEKEFVINVFNSLNKQQQAICFSCIQFDEEFLEKHIEKCYTEIARYQTLSKKFIRRHLRFFTQNKGAIANVVKFVDSKFILKHICHFKKCPNAIIKDIEFSSRDEFNEFLNHIDVKQLKFNLYSKCQYVQLFFLEMSPTLKPVNPVGIAADFMKVQSL